MAATKHDVVVLAWRAEPGLAKRLVVAEGYEEGLRTFRVRYRPTNVPKLEFVYKLYGCLLALWQLRRRHSWIPEVIHAHEYRAGILAVFLSVLTRAPIVISEHNSAFPRGRLERRDLYRAKFVFRFASVVAPVSLSLARFLEGLAGGTPVAPVPNSVDPNVFHPDGRPTSRASTLLTVGHLIEVKGHQYLIDALAQLRAEGVDLHLDVVGEGNLRGSLENQVDELGLADRVTFHGFLPRDAVAELMRESGVFVLPSLWETLSCVLIEAMASGLPVVASNVGGVPELVEPSNGLTVEPAAPAALAEAIRKVVSSRDGYDPDALHRQAVSRYGPDAVARRWSEIYDLALRNHSSQSPGHG